MPKRRSRLEGEIGSFIKQYQRKSQRGVEPNDRGYDREIEKIIKNMKPHELSELMNQGADTEISAEIDEKWQLRQNITGVNFYQGDKVIFITSKKIEQYGTIAMLYRLLPEPEYLIEVNSGEIEKSFQSNITLKRT